jgi:hypothetical protein
MRIWMPKEASSGRKAQAIAVVLQVNVQEHEVGLPGLRHGADLGHGARRGDTVATLF